MEQRKNPATSSQAANPGRDEGKASAHGAQGGNKGASGQSQSGQNQSGQNQSVRTSRVRTRRVRAAIAAASKVAATSRGVTRAAKPVTATAT